MTGRWVAVGVTVGYALGRIKWMRQLAVKIAAARVARRTATRSN